MDWFALVQVVFGDFAVVVVALLTFLVALGVYKLVKDWLPW